MVVYVYVSDHLYWRVLGTVVSLTTKVPGVVECRTLKYGGVT